MNDQSFAYQTGTVLGMVLVLAIFSLPVVFSAMSWRRRRANKKCLLSLILVMATLPLAGVVGLLIRKVGNNPALLTGFGFTIVALAIGSMVLALLGLSEYKARRSRFGKKRAILALVCDALLMVFFVWSGIQRMQNSTHPPTAAQANPPFISETFNFRFTRPYPWMVFDVQKYNSSAVTGAFRGNPQVFFSIIAEKIGVESPLHTAELAEMVKSHLQSAAQSATLVHESRLDLHGINGVRVETDAQMQQGALSYTQWTAVYHGYAYQLSAWAQRGNRQELNAQALDVFQHFELLHPDQLAHAPGYTEAKDYHSLTGGFSIRLAGTEWNRPIRKLFENYPSAEYGVSSSVNDGFVVIPLPLPKGIDPDIEILTQACLAYFSVEYPGENVLEVKDVTHGPLKGKAVTFDRSVAPNIRYQGEILKGNGFAYFLVALATKNTPSEGKLDDILSRVDFEENPSIPAPKEFTSREKESRALFFNEIGLAYYRKENLPEAKQYFHTAQQLAPENPVILLNCVDELMQEGNNREALDFLQANMHGKTRTDKLRSRLAFLQQQTGDVQSAMQTYSDIFSGSYVDDNAFDYYLGLLCQQKKYDEALAQIDPYLRRHDSVSVRLSQASIYNLTKRFAEATKLLEELHTKYPGNTQVNAAMAKTLLSAERYAEAIELCDKLIAQGDGSSVIQTLKGRSELGLKRFREAKTSFEAATKLDPSNADLKSMLSWVSSMLGQGDNSSLKNPLDPVPIPAELILPPKADPGSAYLAGANAYYKTFAKAISFKKGNEFTTTEYRTVKVLNDAGLKEFSSFEIPYDPVSEGIFVNELKVTDKDGNTLSTGKVEDYYLIDDTASGQASQHKLLHIPVSGLCPGCEVSLTVTHRDYGNPTQFRYSHHLFSRPFPILRSVLYVAAPPSSYKALATGGLTSHPVKDQADAVVWSKDQPPVMRYEPLQPTPDLFIPEVCLGNGSGSWEQEGKEYLTTIKDRLELDDATRQKAKEITQSLQKPEEKIAALINAVQADLSYTAIEFGPRARIPNKAETTARNRYGDCKDHALLLRQLLEASGIHANLALVNSAGEFHQELPSLDQFNHMIVFIPSLRGGAFVDCTDKDSDLTTNTPVGLATKEALILDEQHPRIAKIPDYAPEENVVNITRHAEILTERDLSVSEDVILKGTPAAMFRSFCKHCVPSNRKLYVQQQLAAGAPTLEVHDFDAEHVEERHLPLALHITYSAKGRFQNTGGQIIGQIPAVWERFFLASQPVEKRQSPFQISYPLTCCNSTAITYPAGFTSSSLKKVDANGKFTKFELKAASDKKTLRLDSTIHQIAGRFSPAQYSDYYEGLSRIFSSLEQSLVFVEAR